MELKKAEAIANRIITALRPYCDTNRIFVAGSIRRQVAEVGDIEIVALPNPFLTMKVNIEGQELFPEQKKIIQFFDELKKVGKPLTTVSEQSRQIKIMLPEEIKLDLFLPQESDFFRQLAIRTGSRRYSYEALAKKWSQKKWHGTEEGLRLHGECINIGTEDKPRWKCNVSNPTLPPAFNRSEEHFFMWLGIGWVPPQMRNW